MEKPQNRLVIFMPSMDGGGVEKNLIIISNYLAKKGTDNIGHDAHIFGALFGLAFILVIHPSALPDFIEQLKQWDGSIF